MSDLFDISPPSPPSSAPPSTDHHSPASARPAYTASDIEVLEGLESVRRRPGMYIGGTDRQALHHLVREILDNAVDETIAGHASQISVQVLDGGVVQVSDDGRGIPVDPHPRFPNISALEVILTTLHAGAKFSAGAYTTAGGLHGVGLSVVNALSQWLTIDITREGTQWSQRYERGHPTTPLTRQDLPRRKASASGTVVTFLPDPDIFADTLDPGTLYRMARSKAYLFSGLTVHWQCPEDWPAQCRQPDIPHQSTFSFPQGLLNRLQAHLSAQEADCATFAGSARHDLGRIEWAIAWSQETTPIAHSYCNAIPTPQGGNHETALRTTLMRELKAYGAMTQERAATAIGSEDVLKGASFLLSVFIHEPQFKGQTKDKLASPDAGRLVEAVLKDSFAHWLSHDRHNADAILQQTIEHAAERQARKRQRAARKSPTRQLRLPGKLADCLSETESSEIFLVEGDSAGGSAKHARDRTCQAILPLRGKILNVASASTDKLLANQELQDLTQALGCGQGADFDLNALRYDRVIIMTDADVDGAHIAGLLMTFFFLRMPGLVQAGRLYLAQPPLYRLSFKDTVLYAQDDAHKATLMASAFPRNAKVQVSRFKGLGEMPPAQLKETAMHPHKRTLIRVTVPAAAHSETAQIVDDLMGRSPEKRLKFLQENAHIPQMHP